MQRYLFAIVALTGFVGCAAPGAALPTATPPQATPTRVPPAIAAPAPSAAPDGSIRLTSQDTALILAWKSSSGELRRVQLATGQLAPGLAPFDMGTYMTYALSQDGARLAVYHYPENAPPEDASLRLIDPLTLQYTTPEGISFPTTVDRMAFSPDGRRLAVINYLGTYEETPSTDPDEYQVSVIDADRETIIGKTIIDFSPSLLHYSPDGKTIMVYGVRYNRVDVSTPGTPRIALLDAGDLHSLWTTSIEGLMDGAYTPDNGTPGAFMESIWWQAATAFSADMTRLYVVHADVDKLTTIDLAQKTIATMDVSPQKTFLDRLMGFGAGIAHAKAAKGTTLNAVLSADGSKLFVTGEARDVTMDSNNMMQFTTTQLDFRVIDVTSGALLHTMDTRATNIARSVDGSQLFLYAYDSQGGASTEILDAETLESLVTVDDLHLNAQALTLAGGRSVLLAERWTADGRTIQAVLDASTFSLIAEWTAPGSAGWVIDR